MSDDSKNDKAHEEPARHAKTKPEMVDRCKVGRIGSAAVAAALLYAGRHPDEKHDDFSRRGQAAAEI